MRTRPTSWQRIVSRGVPNWRLSLLLFTTLSGPIVTVGADEPIARFALISNPYMTTLPREQIKDENGRVRDFLFDTGPAAMDKVVGLVNRIKPDALIVLGSGTWTGSPADCQRLAGYLDRVQVRTLVSPGRRDVQAGSTAAFDAVFKQRRVSEQVVTINGVALAFADVDGDPDNATTRLEQQLAKAQDAKAVLLLAGGTQPSSRPLLTPKHEAFWRLIERRQVALRLDGSRYGQRVGYINTLPTWTVGSTAWSMRGSVSMVNVYADRLELAEVRDPGAPTYVLTIPNPVAAPRLARADEDPYRCPSYSQDLKQKPDFTFALVSDPQFDRERNRKLLIDKAEAAVAELNRLKPELVFVSGDLVNNNLPEEWELYKQVFGKLEPPHHSAPGNHDVLFNYQFVEASYNAAPKNRPDYAVLVNKALAEAKAAGFEGPTALYERFTGSKPRRAIVHRDCVFITVPFLTTRADPQQIEFLRKQLGEHKDKRHRFVVAHYPSLPVFGNNLQPQQGGSEVLSLLAEHRVTGYLFGHRHRNGFAMHERTAHVLADNMGTIHLLHVFGDRIVIGRKAVGSPLYPRLTLPTP